MSHSAPIDVSNSVTPELRAEPRCETESNSRGLTSQETIDNPTTESANAANNCPTIPAPSVDEASDLGTASNQPHALPLPAGEGWGEEQTGTPPSAVLPVSGPETHNDHSSEVRAAALHVPVHSEAVAAPPSPNPAKKHKPYWLNGHYYENPEYPEHVVRAMFPRAAS